MPLSADIELLRKIPIFASLSTEKLQNVIDSPNNEIVDYQAGETVIEENQIGDCMYIILEGMVDVRISAEHGREITIATMHTGEFFGEQALLPGASGRRNASVRTLRDCHLFKISKKNVVLGSTDGEKLPGEAQEKSVLSKTDRVTGLLRSIRLFRALSPKELKRVTSWTEVEHFGPGDIIVREAEHGDFMYVILEGSVEVFIADDDGKIVTLAELTHGNYFGEQALLPESNGRRNANVRANGEATLIRVHKKYFQFIVSHDNKLMLALGAVGQAQQAKIVAAIGEPLS